jgi:hypothetical protein
MGQKEMSTAFCSVDGILLNQATGDIQLSATPCDAKTPDCHRVIREQDIQEMLQEVVDGAIFSLDAVDPQRPYHPFNQMRFAPSGLYGTGFLQTLLSTDYLLKFFTVGQEVNANYPYDGQTLTQLTAHLPDYLKQVLNQFNASPQVESLHRFWIEAESAWVDMGDAKQESKSAVQKIWVDEVQMVVRKHKMMRDEKGELIDDPNEAHEGWHVYLLSDEQCRRFDSGETLLEIEQPALCLRVPTNTIRFLEGGQRTRHVLSGYNDQLAYLFTHCAQADARGKIILDSTVRGILYRATEFICKQTGRATYFSPEYAFAQSFSYYYNDFAVYFPEFRRLKELCRLVVIVRVLSSIRASTQEAIQSIEHILSYMDNWQSGQLSGDEKQSSSGAGAQIKQQSERVFQEIKGQFEQWRGQMALEPLQAQNTKRLSALWNEMGSLGFSQHSAEVNSVCQKIYDDTCRNAPRFLTQHEKDQVWEQINGMRSDIASRLGSEKRRQVTTQLTEIFQKSVSTMSSAEINQLVRHVLNGNIEAAASQLAGYEYSQAINEI